MQAVIIAAGKSSRFWPLNGKHKALINLCGRSLIEWTIKSLVDCNIKDIIIVCGSDLLFKKELGSGKKFNCKLSYVVQKEPVGTGNAAYQASKLVKKPFFIMHPYKFYAKEIIKEILEIHKKNKAKIILISNETTRPWDYGMLEFKKGKVIKIVENPQPGKEPSMYRTFGMYFLYSEFFDYYAKIKHHEEDLIDGLNLYLNAKDGMTVFLKKDPPTLKYPWNLLMAMDTMFALKDFKKRVPKSAKIGKNVLMKGKVYIGNNVEIGDNTIINGPCYIGDNCKIGALNVFRGPVNLEKEVITGAFAEIKNSIIQEGTHIHSGYFGDSIIGKYCRFGAGFVSANRRIDRKNIKSVIKGKKVNTELDRLGVMVGDNTFFGIQSSTMPGVIIGKNCVVGPGQTVMKNIKDGTKFFKKN